MRSRASGGIWGDSSAAPSAATMSSLRRRAICVTRARSIARSSTGGRASARTTAPASPGSTSRRSQASRSRTSARWKNAAAPDSRYGTARSSNATATAWPSPRTERTSTQTSSGATSSRAISRSTSAATACACARSDVQRQNATSPPASPSQLLGDPVGRGDGARGLQDPLARAVRGLQPHDRRLRPLGAEVVDVLGRGAAEAVDGLVVVGHRCHVAVAGHQQPQEQALGEARVLELVDEHVAVAVGEPVAHVCVGAQEAEAVQHEVADVERPRVGQHPLVGAVELGELALARAVPGQGRGPRGVVVRRHQLVLEAVDPLDDRAERRARVAAQVVVAQRQLVDPLEQHRQAVGGAHGGGERVEPGLERLVAQEPGAEAVEGGHGQLLVGAVEPILELRAQAVGGSRGEAQDEQRLRRRAAAHEVHEPLGQHRRLARAGAAQHEQRAAVDARRRHVALSSARPPS